MNIYNEDFTFVIPLGYGYLTVVFFLISLYIMQGPSYLGKIALVSIWFRWYWSCIKTRVYKDFSLDKPTKYEYLTGITIFNWTKGSWMPLLVLIIHTHAFTYIPDQHWWKRTWRKCTERFIRRMSIPCLRFEVSYQEVVELHMCAFWIR